MAGQTFYHPSENGYEKQISAYMQFIREAAGENRGSGEE